MDFFKRRKKAVLRKQIFHLVYIFLSEFCYIIEEEIFIGL